MQNKYFGDVGDYGKYALLRRVAATELRLGFHWCLFEDEVEKKDGELRAYLQKPENSVLDKEVFELLISNTKKDISQIEPLFTGSLFYKQVLKDAERRSLYENEALNTLKDSDIIFFDPDNGLEVKSMRKKNMYKYATNSLLKKTWNAGKSLIVYQHYDRNPGYLDRKITQIRETIIEKDPNAQLLVIDSPKGTRRSYFFILRKEHWVISGALIQFVSNNPEWYEVKYSKE